MSDSLKPAINNWVWLAELPNMRDALIVGEYPSHVRAGLEQHFENIVHHHVAVSERADLPDQPDAFDCVVFDLAFGEALVSSSMSGGVPFLRQAKRVIRAGGCIYLPVARLNRRRPNVLARPLRRAGFGEIRPMYVYDSFDRPDTVIPVGRRTAAFFESWAWGDLRGTVRAAIALTGAHFLTQSSMFFLAYP